MKTCTSRLTLPCYVNLSPRKLSLLVLCAMIWAYSVTTLSAQIKCEPVLDCTSLVVSCVDPAAQFSGDPGYRPAVIMGCDGMEDEAIQAQLVQGTWLDSTIVDCESDTSHILLRTWNLPGGPTLCEDTIYVIRIMLDSIVCPSGRDTIYCGDTLNAIDSAALRAPRFEYDGLDSFSLLDVHDADLCDLQITHVDSWWPGCGKSGTVWREWSIHVCGEHLICYDTLVLIDTLPPSVSFPGLKKEVHDFLEFSGKFYTDTIPMGEACLGRGLAPYAVVSDSCSNREDITVQVELLGGGILHEYKGDEEVALPIDNIPPGGTVLIYKTRDDCWLYSYDTVVIVVEDITPANAACHAAVNLSLTNVDGLTLMQALSVDADSYDNCGIYKILARRKDWKTACGYSEDESSPVRDFYLRYQEWVDLDPGICQDIYDFGFAEQVPFCCDDVGRQIKVEIVVIDYNCNVDRCWGYVNVEDKVPPRVVEPLPDISINCTAYDTYYQAIVESSDTSAIREAFGEYQLSQLDRDSFSVHDVTCDDLTNSFVVKYFDGLVIDNCGSNVRERYSIVDNGCGGSIIVRDFIALVSTDHGITDQTFATQHIYLTTCLLDDLEVSYPDHDTTIFDCGITFGRDGNTTIKTVGPALPDDLPECSQFGMGFFDKVFDVVSGKGCKKIHRTWCIVDWCEVTFRGSWPDMVGLPGVRTFHQYIKVMDTVPPEITEVAVSDMNTRGCSTPFVGQIDATDGCGQEPEVWWYMHQEGNGLVDQGTGETAAPEDPLLPGNYQILWSAKDACNNVTEFISTFSVTSEALPALVNHSSITAVLTRTESGAAVFGQAEVWASEFNSSSAAPCGGSFSDLLFLIARGHADDSTPVPSRDATALSLTCADYISEPTAVPVQVWVVDTVNNTSDYSNVVVMLQDNHDLCGNTDTIAGKQLVITGSIITETSELVANVQVKTVDNAQGQSVTTNDDGKYEIVQVTGSSGAMIRPEKDTDHGNGISTADLIRLQKHMLGIKYINSPYSLIAADANRDQKLNPIDLIQMRRIVLGKAERFPDNTSWRFVDADYRFKHLSTALEEDFPEYYHMEDIRTTIAHKDFIGIKIGDLNGNVFAGRSSKRNQEYQTLMTVSERVFEKDEVVVIPVYLGTSIIAEGMQMRWAYDVNQLTFSEVIGDKLGLDPEMVNLEQVENGELTISWSEIEGVKINEDEPLFLLKFVTKKEGRISESIALDRRFDAELYDSKSQTSNLGLHFGRSKLTKGGPMLHQNMPNPFRSTTIIGFNLSSEGKAQLTIYDTAGRQIKQVNGTFGKGYHEVEIEGRDLLPGILYYQLQTANTQITKKMVLLE